MIAGKADTATPHRPTAAYDADDPTSLTDKLELIALMLANVKHGAYPAMPTAPTVVCETSDGPVLSTTTMEESTATMKIDVVFSDEFESALIPTPWTRDMPVCRKPLRTSTVLRVMYTLTSRASGTVEPK
jgi:hypothetical protein